MNEDMKWIFESALMKQERMNKRLFILNLVLVISLILSNIAWIYYESQWQYVESETSFEVEQEGDNNYVNNNVLGDYYGSSESEVEE